MPDLHDITMTPRKYGFHGTLKPPFRLREGCTVVQLERATSELARGIESAVCEGLDLTRLGRFLALTPRGEPSALQAVAAACVEGLDGFRAPASDAELARRRMRGLSARQEALLTEWGYPYVMEEFKFHLTLSGRLPKADIDLWVERARGVLPPLPVPFTVDQIALCAERDDGRFEVLHRYMLTR